MNSQNGKTDYDIIVVGGGPSGCAFVRSLVDLKPSLRVLLVDKEKFPRDKVCGDGLTYQAIPLVRQVFPELASLTPSPAFTSQQTLYYPFGPCLVRNGQMLDVIPRLEFDNALWKATVATGVETRENTCLTALLKEGDRVRGVRLQDANGSHDLTCGLLVGADGSRSVVRRATGSTDNDFVIHALRQYVRGIPDFVNGLIFFFDVEHRGYFWIFPFTRNGERCANLGYGNSSDSNILKDRFQHYCATPEVRRYLESGHFEGNPVGFPLNLAKFNWAGRLSRPLWGPGYLLLGDAAALIHPLSGEGIAFSIESGRIAAEVLADDRVPRDRKGATYERRVLRCVRPSFLSPMTFCAIRLPMMLPTALSKALIHLAAFAQRHFGFGIQSRARVRDEPLGRLETNGRSNSISGGGIAPEVVMLVALFAALAAFWAVWFFDPSALPAPYGTRANLFVGIVTAFCLFNARRRYGGAFTMAFFGVALGSFLAAEFVGTTTGDIFGAYHFNPAMQWHLLGLVPVVVPFAWFTVFYLTFATSIAISWWGSSLWLRAAFAAVLFVSYDLVADPNHVYRGGWTYLHGGSYYGIPIHNFIAWGLFGFVGFLLLGFLEPRARIPARNKGSLSLVVIAFVCATTHEGFFALLVAGHTAASVIAFATSAMIIAAHLVAIRKYNSAENSRLSQASRPPIGKGIRKSSIGAACRES